MQRHYDAKEKSKDSPLDILYRLQHSVYDTLSTPLKKARADYFK